MPRAEPAWGKPPVRDRRGACGNGVYRDGKIELTEFPGEVRNDTRVIVTFLETRHIDLRARGIDEAQAAALRAQLGTFAEEWNSPDMALYDNYDAAKTKL